MSDPKKNTSPEPVAAPKLIPDGESVIDQFRIEQTIRLRYSPLPELTMEILSRQLNQFRVGELRPAARTWEVMFERDGELSGPALKRFADTSRLPWEIEKVDESPEANAHAEALDYFYKNLLATSVLEQNDCGGANLLFRQMMTAKAHKYSVHEMLLRVDSVAKRQVTAQFNHCPVWFFENRRGYLAYLKGELDWWGDRLETGKWLTAVGEGLMRQCSVLYGIKHFALRDNLLYASRFGLPGIHGEFSGGKDSPEGVAFAEALKAFANDWVTATYGGVGQAKITLIEAAKGGTNSLPFQELMERADRGYAKLFRGGDLSSSSRAGESRGASLQDEEKTLLLEDDAQWLNDTLNARVDEPIIAYLFNTRPLAWIRVRVPKKPEVNKEIETLNAAAEMKIPVSIKTARERLQLPEPKAGEPCIEIAAGAPAATAKLDKADTALGNARMGTADDVSTALAEHFTKDVAADLAPIVQAAREEGLRIAQIADPVLKKQKTAELLAKLDSLCADALLSPKSADSLAAVIVAGLAAPTALGNQNNNHLPPGKGGGQFASKDSLGDSPVGKSGTWKTLNLPDFKGIHGDAAITDTPIDEARSRLQAGFEVPEVLGGKVQFNQKTLDHWTVESPKSESDLNGRLRRLDQAVDTLKNPQEVWEARDRKVYLQVVRDPSGGRRAISAFVVQDNQVRSYFSGRDLKQANDLREGKLLYAR